MNWNNRILVDFVVNINRLEGLRARCIVARVTRDRKPRLKSPFINCFTPYELQLVSPDLLWREGDGPDQAEEIVV